MGDSYDDDKDEDDDDGNDDEENHCPCLFQKVLPMQSFYDMTQQPASWSDAFLADGGGVTMITMTKIRITTMMTTIMTTT